MYSLKTFSRRFPKEYDRISLVKAHHRNAPISVRRHVCRRRRGVCAGGPAHRHPPRLSCVWYGPRPPAVPRSDGIVVDLIAVRTAALRANSSAVYTRVVVRAAGAPPGGDTLDEVHTTLFAVRAREGGGAWGIGGGRTHCAAQATIKRIQQHSQGEQHMRRECIDGSRRASAAVLQSRADFSGPQSNPGVAACPDGITGETLDVAGPCCRRCAAGLCCRIIL
jgi:hypothetical protein